MESKTGMAITLLSISLGIVTSVLLKRKHYQPRLREAPPIVGIPFFASLAVRDAESKHHVNLDYTQKSITIVDDVLGSAHRKYLSGEIDDGKVRALALYYGAYIGEVARQISRATWDESSMSRPIIEMAIRTENGTCYPVAWCEKRIRNGAVDSVLGKFSFFVLDDAGKLEELRRNRASKDGWA